MKRLMTIFLMIILLSLFYMYNPFSQEMKVNAKDSKVNYKKLTPEEQQVIIHKGTEAPWTGKYVNFKATGTFTCKQCNAPLYLSQDKFDSQCGWPSFDDEVPSAIKRQVDADGRRTEILCANCGAHLGHVFSGEGFTAKNIRHCVNSISLNFVPADNKTNSETAYFAGGCFWGTEHYLNKTKGVITTTVGYMGGDVENPTYKQVCAGNTGHIETVQVEFDPAIISFEELAKLFFEIHDPTQTNGQGPDIGEQYLSVIFYSNDEQKAVSEKLIKILQGKGYRVATTLIKADKFWDAEDYHQDYYEHKGTQPYCHFYTKRF
ncbi:MAG TPA: bifunctional methionine sulfoxide reductase B/A protein [bacterium]|nr:bifunctional methionine sulfoxide reductase B/A protein [bacterium]HPN43337.1 bifunctional methionine sulfoxide reductase B/A protein [bacterium]